MSDEDNTGNADDVEAAVRRRTGGRSARVREAVLRATLDILSAQGPNGLSFSEIGRQAGVHGTSVQRRWGSRKNLLFEAIQAFADQTIKIPNTGSLRADLIAFSRSLADYFATPTGGHILQMLVASVENDPAFAANRAEFVRIRHEAAGAMIRRATERGELRAGVDEETIGALLVGPIYVRLLITRRPVDDGFIERVIDAMLRGVASNPDGASRAEPSDSKA